MVCILFYCVKVFRVFMIGRSLGVFVGGERCTVGAHCTIALVVYCTVYVYTVHCTLYTVYVRVLKYCIL